MIFLRTLLWLVLWAGAALLAQGMLGDPAGWILFCAGLLGILLWWSGQLYIVSRWVRHPEMPPPTLVGPWNDVLTALSRYARAQAPDKRVQHSGTLQSILAAAQALPDGAVMLSKHYQIDWCNQRAQQHLDLRLPSDYGHNLLNLLRVPEFVAYAQRSDWPEPLLVRLNKGGESRLIMMQLAAYAHQQRLLITRDVTQIERLETTRRDFVANVSHELRTPLTVLQGFLETLRELPIDALSSAQRHHYLGIMQEQAQRMQSIVQDLLTLSTLESSPDQEPRPVNMQQLLHTTRQQAEALSNGRQAFDWQIDATLDILGTESELSSALSNLLTNAICYTPEGGTIQVRWEREADGGARYSVQDTGIGIAAHHIARLTERFYRVDHGRSRALGGTGLGLAIAKHIAMRHHAELLITSELGKGSTFALRFPPERSADARP